MNQHRFVRLFAILLAAALMNCRDVDPGEKAAVILGQDFTFCGACGGWLVYVDSTRYRADIREPFNVNSKPVWIRFKKDESDGLKQAGRWIKISSIRDR